MTRKSIDAISNQLVERIFSHSNYRDFSDVHKMHLDLLVNKRLVEVTDYGAGSKKSKSNLRTTTSIVRYASIKHKYGKLINYLASLPEVKKIVELGTSVGTGTAYLAIHNQDKKVFTIEGCPNIAELSKISISNIHKKELNLDNITFYVGEFSTQFEKLKSDCGLADLVYIDGNHTYNATLDYFNYFLANTNRKAILVFDDIHWSDGMEKAWDEICNSSKSRVTVDLFRMGIVFLDPELAKNHYVLKY